MKVVITMEAEVGDLPTYSEDAPFSEVGSAGRQNIYDVVKNINSLAVLKLMEEHSDKEPSSLHAAKMKAYEEEIKLTGRLLESVRIEYKS